MIIVTTEVSFPRKPRTVLANPSHNYTRALLASIPRMPNGPGLAASSSTERDCKAVYWFLIDPGNSDRCSANSRLRTRMLITRAAVENSISSRGPSPSHGF
jgi:ABC-type dipeptide/oligopeptide/nickel transport system ATPase component